MSLKNNTEVIIDGKIYTLSGYESEEYLQKVATYINNKIAEFKKDEAYRRQSMEVQKALLELNIADDYFKAKKQADSIETEIDEKDKQLYDLKHELIGTQIKLETATKELENANNQISELQKDIIRLETQLKEKEKRSSSRTTKNIKESV